jgi:hypothetical protein
MLSRLRYAGQRLGWPGALPVLTQPTVGGGEICHILVAVAHGAPRLRAR